MGEKRQRELEGAEVEDLSLVKPQRIDDHRGIIVHRDAQRKYNAKPEAKEKIRAHSKEKRRRVSKIISSVFSFVILSTEKRKKGSPRGS